MKMHVVVVVCEPRLSSSSGSRIIRGCRLSTGGGVFTPQFTRLRIDAKQ